MQLSTIIVSTMLIIFAGVFSMIEGMSTLAIVTAIFAGCYLIARTISDIAEARDKKNAK